MHLLHLAMILMGTCEFASGARIIMAPAMWGSVVVETVHLGEELVSRGHEVYIAIASRYPRQKDIEKKGIKTLQYKIPDDAFFSISEDMERELAKIVFLPQRDKYGAAANLLPPLIYRDCVKMMNDTTFLNKVKRLNFSLAIVQTVPIIPCYLILPKYLDIPFVSMPFFFPWTIRNPALPSFVPLVLEAWTEPTDITFYSKLTNLGFYFLIDLLIPVFIPDNTTLLQQYAPDAHHWNDLLRQSDLFIYSFDHHFGIPIPEMPNCISAAGLTTTKAQKLPDDLQQLMEQSVDGVILLSFGSSASHFPEHVIVKFLDAFAKLSQTVIAKFVIPKNVKVPKNVKLLSWLPQNDILAHPKTKLFVTHCGIHGVYEALYHGVPIIGVPLFAEQHINSHRAFKKGFGLEMSIQNFTSTELINNIQEILNNPKYRLTMKKASETFRDQPMHPVEKAAFWIEHVIRHGGKHLRTLGMDMPLYQFLMLDIIGLFLVIICGLLFIFKVLFKCIWKRCCRARVEPSLKQKSS